MRPNDVVDIQTLRRKQSEAEFQSAVKSVAVAAGWLFYHPYSSRRSEAGWPDVSLVHKARGLTCFAELKTETGKLTEAQETWLEALATAGQITCVWRPTMIDDITDWLCGNANAVGRIAAPGRYWPKGLILGPKGQ